MKFPPGHWPDPFYEKGMNLPLFAKGVPRRGGGILRFPSVFFFRKFDDFFPIVIFKCR